MIEILVAAYFVGFGILAYDIHQDTEKTEIVTEQKELIDEK